MKNFQDMIKLAELDALLHSWAVYQKQLRVDPESNFQCAKDCDTIEIIVPTSLEQ